MDCLGDVYRWQRKSDDTADVLDWFCWDAEWTVWVMITDGNGSRMTLLMC